MKTLKEIKSEINPEMVLRHIAVSYSKKMGGTRKLIVEGEEIAFVDHREYYSGRGAKYNSTSMHDDQVYELTKIQYHKKADEIAKDILHNLKLKAKMLRNEKQVANNWKDDIDVFIQAVKDSWHLGTIRVWHNVIPCGDFNKSIQNKYLKNQLRNWLLSNNNISRFGFKYYEDDYNYSDYYFLSEVKSLNKNNPDIWDIFEKELSGLKITDEHYRQYYGK